MTEYKSVYFFGTVHIGGPKLMLTDRDYVIRREGDTVTAEERNGSKRVFEIPRDRCVLEQAAVAAAAAKAEGKK